MILDVLTLHNFRQYSGTQRIFFSKDRSKNVTVIHGENGAGKTALLGAFGWCLYGKADLPDPDDIISESSAAEARLGDEVEAYVKLEFSDDTKNYFVTRRVRAIKGAAGLDYSVPVLELQYIDETGKSMTPKNGQDTIEQIIPSDLRTYFFFDGERIDNLTKKEGVKGIKKAIKILMGLEILERGSSHLDEVKRRFRDDSAKYGDAEMQSLVKEIGELENQIASKKRGKETLLKNRQATESDLAAVRERLRSLEGSRELQSRKDELQATVQQVNAKIADVRKKLRAMASKRGYLAFCPDVIEDIKKFLDEKRKKSEIPSPLKQQFVDDLLGQGMCICGTPLIPGHAPHNHVSGWRVRASTQKLEDAFIDLTGDVKVLQSAVPQLFADLRRLQAERETLRQSLKEAQEELSQVEAQLEGKDTEVIAGLARRDRELESTLRDTDQAIGRVEGEIEGLTEAADKKDKALKAKQVENDKAKLAKRRMEACDDVQQAIQAILELQSEDVQKRLQRKISDVHSKMLRKGYEAVIDEDYLLTVNKMVGAQRIPVRMSQGERQVTSLSFIGALVDIAREQYERDKERSAYFKGGYYPIVMDSPFGSMDEDHRERTALGIPSLAHQVIVMASSSQWSGPVQKVMQRAVGREYMLTYHSPKIDQSVEYEYTAIKEGKHA